MLDTVRSVETPEGIELELRIAGPVSRATAWALDFAIRLVAYIVIFYVFGVFGWMGVGFVFIFSFLVEWFYPVVFEVMQGATPGKYAIGLAVVHDNGTPVGWSASMLRNLLRVVDFLPFFYGFGLACVLINRDFKRLGDLAAGTVVVYRPRRSMQAKAIPPAPACPLPRNLSLEHQRSIVEFAERAADFSDQRRRELASLLEPYTGKRDAAAVARLYQYANWLLRGK